MTQNIKFEIWEIADILIILYSVIKDLQGFLTVHERCLSKIRKIKCFPFLYRLKKNI